MITDKQAIADLKIAMRSIETLYHTILIVYREQTESEKNTGFTIEHNGYGFSGADAEVMSRIAEKIINHQPLTQWENETAYKRMPKYAGQIWKITKNKVKK